MNTYISNQACFDNTWTRHCCMQSVAKEGVVVKKLAVPFQSVVEDTKVRKESHYYHLVMEANK